MSKLYGGAVFIIALLLVTLIFAPVAQAQVQRTVSLQTDVQESLTFTISAGATVNFGNLTPGTPIPAPNPGTETSVTTNAANGYTLSLHDSVAGGNSCLTKGGGVYIPDYSGTIGVPTVWVDGTSVGLGITLFSCATAAHKDAKWGTGAAYNDALNKYAGIPTGATVANTVSGYHATTDVCEWAYKLDAAATQETGVYSGSMTFTATAVL
jgi:hypothetical protein